MADTNWITTDAINPESGNYNSQIWGNGQLSGPDSYWSNLGYDPYNPGQPITGNNENTMGNEDPALRNWFNSKGYTLASSPDYANPGGKTNAILDKDGNMVKNSNYYMAPDSDPMFWSFANAMGGMATGGFLGQMGTLGNTALGAGVGASNAVHSGNSVLKGAFTGALGGGLGSLTADLNPAGMVGVTDPNLSSAVNKGISGGVSAAVNGGNILQSAALGAIPDVANYGAAKMDFSGDTGASGGYSPSYWRNENSVIGSGTNQSMSPYTGMSNFSNGNFAPVVNNTSSRQEGDMNPFMSHIKSIYDGIFGNAGSGTNFNMGGKSLGNWAEGLAGMYMANRQRKQAGELLNTIQGNRNAYQTQLRSRLARQAAAGGRAADIGGQETALQSGLAELDARNAPAVMNLQNAQLGGLMNMFRGGLNLGGKQGWFGDLTGGGTYTPFQAPQPLAMPNVYEPQATLDPYALNTKRNPFGG